MLGTGARVGLYVEANSMDLAAERADRRIKESYTGSFIVQTLQRTAGMSTQAVP
jgi:hypothetical protein